MSRLLSALALLTALVAPADAQSLRGSPASVERMYRRAVASELHFYASSGGVHAAVAKGTLVRMSGNADYRLDRVSYAYVLPETRAFVQQLARRYRAACGEQMVVTSAIRPQSMRLANSVSKSVHPTGMAVDLRRPARASCLGWLRRNLSELEGDGVIEATEERNPPHFHVAVFPGRAERVAPTQLAARTSTKPEATGQRTHRVRRGESIWTIARRSNVSVASIKSANGLRSSRILAGQLLVIPEAR